VNRHAHGSFRGVRRGSEVFARVGDPQMLSPSGRELGRLPFWEAELRVANAEVVPQRIASRPSAGSAVNKGLVSHWAYKVWLATVSPAKQSTGRAESWRGIPRDG
jgi:hypothetical protein